MGERPILFRDDMVRAILDGSKTVTRRVGPSWARVAAGDRLWVREAHVILDGCCWPDLPHRSVDVLIDPADDEGPTTTVWSFYRAGFDRSRPGRWRPSIHMPRWASRLTLEVVSVTEQQVGGCSDAIGLECMYCNGLCVMPDVDDAEARREGFGDRADFLAAWASMHPDYRGPVYRIEFPEVAVTARPLDGYLVRWSGLVLIARAPDGTERSIGEVDDELATLDHPVTGERLYEVPTTRQSQRASCQLVEAWAGQLGATTEVEAAVEAAVEARAPTGRPSIERDRVVAVVLRHPEGVQLGIIADEARCTTHVARYALQSARGEGLVECRGWARGARWYPPGAEGVGHREPLIPEPSPTGPALAPVDEPSSERSIEGPGATPVAEAGEVPVEPSPAGSALAPVDEPISGPGEQAPVATVSSVGVAQRGGRTEDAPATSAPPPARPPTDPGPDDDDRSLLALLVDEVVQRPGTSASELAPVLEVSSRHASRLASVAIREGLIEEAGTAGGRRLFPAGGRARQPVDPLSDLLLLATLPTPDPARVARALRIAHRLGVAEGRAGR